MSITAKELAKILNLSEAAISMALNNKPGVSTQTRKKVIATAKEYGYDFSKLAETEHETVSNGSIYFLLYRRHGAVVSDTPFFSQLSEGIEAGCRSAHYHMNLYYLYETDDIEAQLKEIIRLGCKGIILLGTEIQEADFKPFSKLSVPLVLLDSYFENYTTDCVLINNVQGAYLATRYLIANCKTQPGYLHSSYHIQNFMERADGFYKALRTSGMSTSRSIVHKLTPSVEGAYADMLALIQSKEPLADAYFADNDLIAAGAIRALRECGYRIPKDISIVGFDDMPLCTYVEPPLTTVRVPKQYMGEIAVKRLVELIETKNPAPLKIAVETELVKRGSVLPA